MIGIGRCEDLRSRQPAVEACAYKSQLKSVRYSGIGEAFGVRRSSAAFPALQFANDSLVSSYTFSDPKAGKAALDRRTPKASPFRDISLFSIGFYLHMPQSRNPVICAV